jgi:hypothetical protein
MSTPPRGAALALVLWGLVVGGALLTLITMLAVQEQRAASALRQEERGLVGAERLGAELLSRLTVGQLRAGLARAFDSLPLDAGGGWSALVRRLRPDLFLLEVSPRLAGPASREAASVRLGWLLRPELDSFAPVAAVSVGGSVALGDDVVISGVDGCAPPDSAIAGIAAESVFVSGSATLLGAPPQVSRTGRDPGAFNRLGERATHVLSGGSYAAAPATVGTSCDPRSPTNWGDPENPGSPCGGYFPLIRVDGDLTLNGGVGQGILLVNGNLHVTSGFTFHGIVIVTGGADITAQTDVSGIFEAVELRSGAGPVTQLKVRYSKCIVSNVLEISSPVSPLPSRAWNQLFQAP